MKRKYLSMFDKRGKELYSGCTVRTMKKNILTIIYKDGCYGCKIDNNFIPIGDLPYNTFDIIEQKNNEKKQS